MGIPGSANPMLFGGAAAYEIDQSLRFNDAYLSRTPSSAGNRRTFTTSVWLKKSESGAISGFWGAWTASALPDFRDVFRFDSNSTFRIFFNETSNGNISSSAVYRDFSAWYHAVMAVDTTQATAANRVKLWINGESVSFGSATYPTQNSDLNINNTVAHYVGTSYDQTNQEWQGYMAEFNHVDGTALTPSSFGETDTITGAWIPKKYSGSYGTNGFYLKFDPSATNGIGHDHSGNGNNFTATGFSTSGTGTDVMSDTPTNNYATLNPVDNASGATLANGNLETTSGAANYKSNFGTIFASSGKWYAEFTVLAGSNDSRMIPGVGTKQTSVTTNLGNDTYSYSINYDSGNSTIYKRTNNTLTALTSTGNLTTNSVVMVALDLDNNKLWFGQDGTWFDSGAPASGTNQIFSITAGEYTFMPCTYSDGKFAVNFGQRSFSYTPPTGYKALNTANLPEPTIKKGSTYFDTVTYSGATSGTAGAGTTQAVTGLGFSPDLVWIKNRSNANSHGLFDQVRGAVNALRSDLTNAEATTNSSGALSAFDSNGFTLANGSSGSDQAILTHQSGYTYVAWAWDANGAGSSNTAGSITSTVSANATAGFSIVTYTGTGANATVGHGLGVAPKMIIVKNRPFGGAWGVYHASLTSASYYLLLNSTAGQTNTSNFWNSTAPTSTLFSLGDDGAINRSGDSHVAYCFSEVAGYSKFGSYTGNGSSDGPFVFCGFRPRFILVKVTSTSGAWYIYDTARSTYNAANHSLYPNLSSIEDTSSDYLVDILSNGFKWRSSNGNINGLNGTYIFAAFAELPAKYSNAR